MTKAKKKMPTRRPEYVEGADAQRKFERALTRAHRQGFIEGWYSNYEASCKCGHLGSQHISYHGCAAEGGCACKEFDCPADPPDFDAIKEEREAAVTRAVERERERCAKVAHNTPLLLAKWRKHVAEKEANGEWANATKRCADELEAALQADAATRVSRPEGCICSEAYGITPDKCPAHLKQAEAESL